MSRVFCGLLLSLCCSGVWGQYPIYPALAQPPAWSAYQQAFPQPFYPPLSYPVVPLYGFGGYGLGPYGFGARGYYPPNPYGNMNWLPPNPPSPYYVTPSGPEYLEQARRKDQATYSELIRSKEQ